MSNDLISAYSQLNPKALLRQVYKIEIIAYQMVSAIKFVNWEFF